MAVEEADFAAAAFFCGCAEEDYFSGEVMALDGFGGCYCGYD